MILALINQKGGVGKSMLAVSLAVRAAELGQSVVLVEGDPTNNSVASWHAERTDPLPITLCDEQHRRLGDRVRDARLAADLVLIDTPGQQTPFHAEAALLADLLLVPCGANFFDLKALLPTLRLVWLAMHERPGLKAAVVLSRVRSAAGCRAVRQDLSRRRWRCGSCGQEFAGERGLSCPACGARGALALPSIPVLATEVSERLTYPNAIAAGKAVTTYRPQSDPAVEIACLYDEVLGLLTEDVRR